MGLFSLFYKLKNRKKRGEEKYSLTEKEKRHNRMWDLWAEDKLPAPCSDLMLYQAEVNNGGHDQFFFNLENRVESDAFDKAVSGVRSLLSGGLLANFEKALAAYKAYDDDEDAACEVLDNCDDYYYENEEEINTILEGLWEKIDNEQG